ncbi:TPA: ABC transporter permease [Clostridioides difficile]|uniref:ABC transporter permease n=1 Tax=Clostridioides difficile TaxID=1496 RepID=UPI000E4D8035|nr:ABC transporter permease [Clostridioides difficile]AXU74387.1 lantibiotic ABC transporter permease [Clostridioides difficile]MDF3817160.1 ABC transporter permease [Clostridioides difficile]MDK3181251.1 ABC transporter permease [Clostridioides difficile]MDL0417558.1 ABC transporter permease [Clostridioides difficile]VHY51559.1 lantibiotic ABC transporter permease [Clostridioides difficile]
MAGIIKTEFKKLKRYFIVWIGIALMLLTVLLTMFTSMADDGMVWNFQVLSEQVIKNFTTLTFPMCITIITGYIISRETTDDTLKNIVIVPVSYSKLLFGKIIVSSILSLFLGMVCFVFTVATNLVMGYSGLTMQSVFISFGQMVFLALFLFFAVMPIIVAVNKLRGNFLIGVVLAFVYGFIGMFTGNSLFSSIYPISAALGMIHYRSYEVGVYWNTPLCALSILSMFAIGIAIIFLGGRSNIHEPNMKEKRVVQKKGW